MPQIMDRIFRSVLSMIQKCDVAADVRDSHKPQLSLNDFT